MKIRKMRTSDLRSCAKFFQVVYSKSPFNEKWQDDNAYKYLANKFKHSSGFSYVLVDDRKILGFIIASFGYWASGPQAIIEEIAVDYDYQHLGLGSQLMEYVQEQLKKSKVKSILLWTKKESLAYRFHQKHGFSPVDDLVIMHRNEK